MSDKQITIDLRKVFIHPQANGRTVGYQREELEDLILSIESRGGLIEPVVITKTPEQYKAESGGLEYMLVAGFRRSYSCKNLADDTGDEGWFLQPAVVMADNSLKNIIMTQLTENFVRKDMNVIDVASHIQSLINECKMSNKQIADQLGIDPTIVSQYLRVLKLPEDVLDLVHKDKITYSAARELCRLPLSDEKFKGLAIEMAMELSFTKFKKFVDDHLGNSESSDEAEGDGAEGDGTQKGVTNIHSIRPKTIETDILPYIEQQLAKTEDDNVKATLAIYKDALAFVLKGTDSDTKLAAYVKPYFDHKREEAEAAEAVRKEESNKKFWFAANIKSIRDLLNPENYGEGKPRGNTIPTVAQALQEVKARIAEQLKNGVVKFVRKETEKVTNQDGTVTKTETATDAAFAFTGTVDQLLEEVSKAYTEHVKKAKEAAEARRRQKEEADKASNAAAQAEPVGAA